MPLRDAEKTPFNFNNRRNIFRDTKSDETHLNHNLKLGSTEIKGRFKAPYSLLQKQKGGLLSSQRFKTPSRPTKKSDIGRSLLSVKKPVQMIPKVTDLINSKDISVLNTEIQYSKRPYISSLGNLKRCGSDASNM